MRTSRTILIILLMALLLSACGSGQDETNYDDMDASKNDGPAGTNYDGDSGDYDSVIDSQDTNQEALQRKVIKTGTAHLQTKKFDDLIEVIKQETLAKGGFIESSYVEGTGLHQETYDRRRRANFTLRIPQEYLEFFLDGLLGHSSIVSQEYSSEDISDQYFDVEARLQALKIQQDHLLDLLKKADKINDMLTIESRLSQVNYEIDQYTGKIKKWDKLVTLSTLHIKIQEVAEESLTVSKKPTFITNIKDAFVSGTKGFVKVVETILIFISYMWPYIILALVLGLTYKRFLYKK